MFTRLALIATARADKAARRLGLVADSAGLWFRALRLQRHWAEHEKNCHKLICEAAGSLTRRRSALVLGSGLLRDVPLPFLAGSFERVVLVDAVHLWPARRQASRYGNVRMITSDVSGRLAALAFNTLPQPALQEFLGGDAIDFTVSANIMSQLPIAAEEWLEKRGKTAADIASLSHTIIAEHLAALMRLPGKVCLISDIEMEERDRSGSMLARHDLIAGHRLPSPDKSWDWPVAPFGIAEPDRAYIHRVAGFGDFKQASGMAGA